MKIILENLQFFNSFLRSSSDKISVKIYLKVIVSRFYCTFVESKTNPNWYSEYEEVVNHNVLYLCVLPCRAQQPIILVAKIFYLTLST